jgi:hypothetical protein
VLIQELEALSTSEADLESDVEGGDEAQFTAALDELANGINLAYREFFQVQDLQLSDGTTRSFQGLSEADFQRLGQTEPQV